MSVVVNVAKTHDLTRPPIQQKNDTSLKSGFYRIDEYGGGAILFFWAVAATQKGPALQSPSPAVPRRLGGNWGVGSMLCLPSPAAAPLTLYVADGGKLCHTLLSSGGGLPRQRIRRHSPKHAIGQLAGSNCPVGGGRWTCHPFRSGLPVGISDVKLPAFCPPSPVRVPIDLSLRANYAIVAETGVLF